MFSSINKLNICEKDPKISSKYKKIFLYRDINKRTISCFLNWMIKYPLEKDILNFKYENVNNLTFGWLIFLLCKQKEFNLKNYLSMLKKDDTIELFKLYLKHLPYFYKENGHTRDQYTIISKKKVDIDIYIDIDNKKEIENLETIIGQKIPITHESDKNKKQILLNFLKKDKKYNDIIKDVYIRDIDFLPIYQSL